MINGDEEIADRYMRTLDFYFDFLSPYAYLAWKQVVGFCQQHDLQLHPRPIVFIIALRHWGQLGPAQIPPKREFTFKDVQRRARRLNLQLKYPPGHPFKPITPLRLALPEVAGEQQTQVIDCLFDAAWAKGRDISELQVLQQSLLESGLDAQALLDKTQDEHVKRALRKATDAALHAGVFGVPTLAVDGELFWGEDQFGFIADHLAGQDQLQALPPLVDL